MTYWKNELPHWDDPLEIFFQLCGNKKNTLLLESSKVNSKKKTKSKIIIQSALRITAKKGAVHIAALSKNGADLLAKIETMVSVKNASIFCTSNRISIYFLNQSLELDEDTKLIAPSIFDSFRWIIQTVERFSVSSIPLFFGGLFSYNLIAHFENITNVTNHNPCPDLCWYLAESLIDIDHTKQTSHLFTYVFTTDCIENKRLMKQTKKIIQQFKKKYFSNVAFNVPKKDIYVTGNLNDSSYAEIIKKMRVFIQKGDIFQVVPSRQFYAACTHPLQTYNVLKKNNPSPYMFFMQDKNFILFGSSPESYLKYNANNRIIQLCPIAGTKPRGKHKNGNINVDLDNRIELSLRLNRKELSEHIMLVDLARNDLAKVCEINSRYVSKLLQVEKYSHVMHLVSHVRGILRLPLDVFHAYQSCMNMGTLTGAPKLRAMQLIAQYEPNQRGAYGGSIGYFKGNGSFDTCIVIRSAFVQKNIATIQSGAGIVADSIVTEEILESKNKAQAILQSIFNTHSKQIGKLYV
uniref:Anthranilate synthase component 1 n=1 Tax=Buchnera aphidicola (Cinara cedri) TaxID=261318 RepID=B4YQR1_9GAMM|nr:anthranilate synthase alpha subunit [Buchnera aphidicola BCc]